MNPRNLSIKDFTYHLPDDKIALHPLKERDASRLLIFKNQEIKEAVYKNIADFISENSLLIYNNTKVIEARILFSKSTGGVIEIFLLEPYNADYTSTLTGSNSCQWKCFIGGAAKWKAGSLQKQVTIQKKQFSITASLIEKQSEAYIVKFSWAPGDIAFAEILEQIGSIPLPPYIKRNPEEEDKDRYQTIYARQDGSVAAPTAGLHFTNHIFSAFELKGIAAEYVTLHVGAGTFKPVKSSTMEDHWMHEEWMDVSIFSIENMLKNLQNTIVAVGTTSLRTIESLYWMGVKTILYPAVEDLKITQWEIYERPFINTDFTPQEALTSLLEWMRKRSKDQLFTQTQILIAPGYTFKIAKAIITNFHQPQSTLLLLVAAATGKYWKQIYEYALQHNFRFLSYGDGSLLFIQ